MTILYPKVFLHCREEKRCCRDGLCDSYLHPAILPKTDTGDDHDDHNDHDHRDNHDDHDHQNHWDNHDNDDKDENGEVSCDKEDSASLLKSPFISDNCCPDIQYENDDYDKYCYYTCHENDGDDFIQVRSLHIGPLSVSPTWNEEKLLIGKMSFFLLFVLLLKLPVWDGMKRNFWLMGPFLNY